jgi:glutamate-5-semialdehyde dehydrogenase
MEMSRAYKVAIDAKRSSREMSSLGTTVKNGALKLIAKSLVDNMDRIIEKNGLDVESGKAAGLSSALIDRLTLTPDRIRGMADAVLEVSMFKDPVGEILEGWNADNGMTISKVRVPIGVLLMIYEARPNVTIDAAALAIKSGNAIILKGGKEANNSNMVLAEVLGEAAKAAGLPENAVQLFVPEKPEELVEMMQLSDIIDTVIPRGGVGLKKFIVENSKIPVILTGAGVCHVYVDKYADPEKAMNILINSKTHRPGVCNAAETLLIHSGYAHHVKKDRDESGASIDADMDKVKLLLGLREKGVEIVACDRTRAYYGEALPATEEDWSTEYLDMKISVKTVDSIDEAIDHINRYGSGHSESIVSEKYGSTEKFLKEVDAAAVYANVSTRFTDGGVFGFGGEIGISTQKLHARGPMGVRELTTCKYIIRGEGQVR